MCKYEELLQDAFSAGVSVVEKNFCSDAKGLCKGSCIGIRYGMNNSEKACILAEELGHYYTTVGNILDQRDISNQKQEYRARAWAYERLLPLYEINRAILAGCHTFYDMAEYLDLDESFLQEAFDYYSSKYGDRFWYQDMD